MGSKRISISEEAYRRLLAHRREDESLSDVLLRLTDDERDVMSGFGAMRDVDGFRDAVETGHEDFDGERYR